MEIEVTQEEKKYRQNKYPGKYSITKILFKVLASLLCKAKFDDHDHH